jgi:hypothetical protein
LEGLIQTLKKRQRLVVSVNVLRRSVANEVDSSPIDFGNSARCDSSGRAPLTVIDRGYADTVF